MIEYLNKKITFYNISHPIALRIFIYTFFLIIIIFLWFFSNFYLIPSLSNVNGARYLLSALLQSQAAIISIVITVSFIVVQLSSAAYTPKVIEIYKKKPGVWVVLMIFLISISYDLYILKIIQGDTSTISLKEEYLVSFAFWLGLYTFFCLIPYLIDVIHLLNPKTIIEYLVHEIRKDNITNDIDNPFQPIFDLIQVSINRYDLMTARSGLDEVYKKVIKICESLNIQYDESGGTGEINDITIIYVKHLLRCGSLAIRIGDVELATEVSSNIDKFGIYLADKRLDDSPPHLVEEPKLVVAALTDFALESINAGLDQVTDSILASISAIMVHGFDNDNKNLFIQGILVFEKIGKNAAKHEKRDILQGIITYIAKLGFESKMSEFNDGTSQALVGLLSLGVIASEYNLRDCHILAANEFRRLAAILDILIVLPLLMHSQDDFKDNPHFISFIKTFDPSLNIPITIEDLEKAYKKKSSSE